MRYTVKTRYTAEEAYAMENAAYNRGYKNGYEIGTLCGGVLQKIEKVKHFRNCKDCNCFIDEPNYRWCIKFTRTVNPENDGCTFYDEWDDWGTKRGVMK